MPKLREDALAVSDPGVKPLPARETGSVGLEALLTIEMLPVAEPPVCGAKATLKLELCPAARVSGRLNPLMLKPVPVTVA